MIRRARLEDTLFRHTAHGREPLAAPSSGGDHVHYQPTKRVGLGSITSRDRKSPYTFWELLAFELSGAGDPNAARVPFCTPRMAKDLFDQGLLT